MSFFHKKTIALMSGIFVFAAVLAWPIPEDLAPEGQRMLAVTGLMCVWWLAEAIHISATALLPLILFPLLGIMSSKEVASNYGNQLVFLFLGGFMIALAMEKWNFHKRVAMVIIVIVGTSPQRIVLGFMLATAFLSMWISNTATAMMMLPVAMAVVNQIAVEASLDGERGPYVEKKIRSGFGLILMLAIAYSASIGGLGTLIGTPPNIVFAGFYRQLFPDQNEIGFFRWMTLTLPLVGVLLPLTWIYLCRWASPIKTSSIDFSRDTSKLVRSELNALGSMSRAEKYVAGVFFSAAFLWIFRKPISFSAFSIPGWGELFDNSKYLHDSTVAMVMGLLLFLLPLNRDKGVLWKGRKEFFVLDWNTLEKGIPWSILLLFGGGFALAHGFNLTGLDLWLGSHLSAIADWPQWLMILMVCLSVTFLTELTSNTATATMILPVLGSAAKASGTDPLLLMTSATLATSLAFMLPVATPPNAIVFSSGWVTIPKMVRAGLVINLFGAILTTVWVNFGVTISF